MKDDQFTQLFRYVQDQFELVNQKLDEKSSQEGLDSLVKTMDGFLKRTKRARN